MIKSLFDVKAIKAYLMRIGAEPRSLHSAVVKEQAGKYWKDIAVVTVSRAGEVKTPAIYAPTESEAAAILHEAQQAEWPELAKINSIRNAPEAFKDEKPENLFEFRDENNNIIMLQQRVSRKGEKAYIPWTFWSDEVWRPMEPEGKLPLWGIEQLKANTTVFIHEGAKAARHVRWMTEGETEEARNALAAHPWGEELGNAAHLGWIGGALNPSRTDWSIIKRLGIKRAYIVSDNDEPGVAAVSAISFQLRVPTFHLQFTGEWPMSFDLADPFPEKMFSKIGATRHFIGPSFRTCLHPATWATDLVPTVDENGRSKTLVTLRDEFKSMWAYVDEVDMFVCTEMPEIVRTETIMDKMLAGFSHVQNTGSKIVKSYKGRSAKLCYRPDLKGRIISDRTTSAINLHQPTTIKPRKGDPKPWLDFLDYLFPNEAERLEVMRWAATLIARPEVRMEYSLLLISEQQGTGKSTFASRVLAPLVGENNVGFPGEDEIVNSNFNGWLVNKRLVVVGEIYSGHSWKAYNKLKGYITDKDIEVNQKYLRPHRIENWVHFVASSNSRKALKMEENDRRWFYPQVSEEPWPKAKFGEFHEWLASGGLQIIHHWAKAFGNYVVTGERAPTTGLKRQMIEESRSEAQQEFADFCEAIVNDELKVFVAMKEVNAWLKQKVNGRMFDTDHELVKIAQKLGWWKFPERIKIGSQLQTVLGSPATLEWENTYSLADVDERKELRGELRKVIVHPSKLEQNSL